MLIIILNRAAKILFYLYPYHLPKCVAQPREPPPNVEKSFSLPITIRIFMDIRGANPKVNFMAELSRFFGIIISMFGADHNPPHIHIRYGDFEAIITIQKEIIKGEMPARILKLVLEWIDLHRDELLVNWKNAQKGLELNKIEPLK